MVQRLGTLALFGGTFDPVHNGHLRMALELTEQLQLDDMRLMPSHRPPHKNTLGCNSEDRAAMVELATADCPQLSIDRREMERDAPSYMVDTLTEVRREVGPDVSLILAMGMDSLVNLDSWYRWRELTDFAHLLVVARPGWHLPEQGDLADFLRQHQASVDKLYSSPQGSVVIQQMSLLPISATEIRRQISAGESPQFLLPDSVWAYIQRKQLYRLPTE
ncbi:nicotinate-nucleotide adenylyltransferase [Maricurvus nonylphenolicus]|uniref:nicotinate-nucleotide adenylyltransferase n=1 Tax=Maricurvus nonylphenolicus TaxID=1008307 RepID=UPI0036F3B141